MKKEPQPGFFRDDGTPINTDLIAKPSLCVSCRKDDDPDEEILCTLTRADQEDEKDFQCGAFEARVSSHSRQ